MTKEDYDKLFKDIEWFARDIISIEPINSGNDWGYWQAQMGRETYHGDTLLETLKQMVEAKP